MYKALIIGCGNIGAQYDLDSDTVSTYAKAFHLDPEIEFQVFDTDREVAERISRHYRVDALRELDPTAYAGFDIIAICTPTPNHHEYLLPMLESGPRVIVCEKPIDDDPSRLGQIAAKYSASKSKVIVNLYRRFLPAFIELKGEINDVLSQEQCTNVVVTYQRGFHNNAIHAVDLLEFLFESNIGFDAARVSHEVADEFEYDPTLCVSCDWNRVNLQFLGLANVRFSHFEIAIYYSRRALLIRQGGNSIEWWKTAEEGARPYPPLELISRREFVLRDHMQHVVAYAKALLRPGANEADNFEHSVGTSARMLGLMGVKTDE